VTPAAFDWSLLGTAPWLLAFAAAFAVGLAKGGLSGFGAVTVLFMAEAMPARASTGVVLPLLIIGDLYSVRAYGVHTEWKYVHRLVLPVMAGVVLGWALMNQIPDALFRPVMGWIILGLSLLQVTRRLAGEAVERLAHSMGFAAAMGLLGGVATMLANAAGPIMALYFLSVQLPKFSFLGTQAWLFFMLNSFKVPFSAHLGLIDTNVLLLVVVLSPAVVLGVVVARLTVNVLPQRLFEWLILIFSILSALRLIAG
jgi:uncharacterized protein